MDAVEDAYPLDVEAKEKLFANGFVVLNDYECGNISDCYWNLFGQRGVHVFITSDALLHIFHVVHDNTLKDIEKQFLYNSTEQLVQDLQKEFDISFLCPIQTNDTLKIKHIYYSYYYDATVRIRGRAVRPEEVHSEEISTCGLDKNSQKDAENTV